LTKGCEESKIMMKDKLDGPSNFKFLEDMTLEEDLLWVIQKGLPETTINEWKEYDVRTRNLITYSIPYIEGLASK
jgi:hypothetical protein